MPPEPTLAARLTAARERANLSVYALAKLAGVDRTFLALIERGEKLPGVETLQRLAGVLGVSMDALAPPVKGEPPCTR